MLFYIKNIFLFLREKHLTFVEEHVKVMSIKSSYQKSDKAVTKTAELREPTESWYLVKTDDFPVQLPIPSEPKKRTF